MFLCCCFMPRIMLCKPMFVEGDKTDQFLKTPEVNAIRMNDAQNRCHVLRNFRKVNVYTETILPVSGFFNQRRLWWQRKAKPLNIRTPGLK